MKRALPFLMLLGLAPLGCFVGSYLEGAGVLPRGSGFAGSAVCMFILPWMHEFFVYSMADGVHGYRYQRL
jgi:hypothetical protein